MALVSVDTLRQDIRTVATLLDPSSKESAPRKPDGYHQSFSESPMYSVSPLAAPVLTCANALDSRRIQ